MKPGVVYLVGAGPGDPSLLTVRARELLQAADVVAYDELCSDALLALVPATAELLSVGRRGHGAPVSYRLHPAVLERARAGLGVVRLKAGDPFIFGRGGEEAEELLEAGVPFEIVPGVSSALGAAAYAGIPLTHRGLASEVTFATGHQGLDLPGDGTLVLFMACRRLSENLRRLVDDGRAPTTPAAFIAAATTGRQRVVVSTLAELAATVDATAVDADAPALIVVGDVVSLRAKLSWIEARPLWGRRVLVGRARPGRSEVEARLSALGAEVLEAPEVRVAEPASFEPLDRALVELGRRDAVVFASAEAVTFALGRLGALGRDLRTLPPLPFIAVGKPAAAALRSAGLVAAVEAHGACAEALAAHERLRKGRLLVLADDGGRPQLSAELTALGATVEVVAAYRHAIGWPHLFWDRFDLVIAPSSSAALHLGDGAHAQALRAHRWLAMGPLSAAAARKVGAREVAVADRDDVDALVDKARELLS